MWGVGSWRYVGISWTFRSQGVGGGAANASGVLRGANQSFLVSR